MRCHVEHQRELAEHLQNWNGTTDRPSHDGVSGPDSGNLELDTASQSLYQMARQALVGHLPLGGRYVVFDSVVGNSLVI